MLVTPSDRCGIGRAREAPYGRHPPGCREQVKPLHLDAIRSVRVYLRTSPSLSYSEGPIALTKHRALPHLAFPDMPSQPSSPSTLPPDHLVPLPVSGWIEPLCGFATATTSPETAGSVIGRPHSLHRIGSVLGPFSMTTSRPHPPPPPLTTPPNHYACIRRLPLQTAKAVYKSSVD